MPHRSPATRLTGPAFAYREGFHPAARSRRPWRAFAAAGTLAVAGILVSPVSAAGSATLIARRTAISVDGLPTAPARQADATDEFDRFAGSVGTPDGPPGGLVSVVAQQYSAPGLLGASGAGLEGAFGEGRVWADVVDEDAILPAAIASSRVALEFRIEGGPAEYRLGASFGATGGGTVRIELLSADGPTVAVPDGIDVGAAGFGAAVPTGGAGQSLETRGVLAPGDYLFRVRADAADTAGGDPDASAYFSFSLSLSDAGGTGVGGGAEPPAAVPLPPAGLAGGVLLGLISVLRRVRGRHRRRG